MALDPAQVKRITDNLESTYLALNSAVTALTALVQTGRATCDEVKAYNLWALALYNTQRGMLTTLRTAGEQNIPALPRSPTLFVWRGVAGADAWKIDCGAPVSGLSDAMNRALRGPQPNSVYLSANEIEVYTQNPSTFSPSQAPSLASLVPSGPIAGALGLAPLIWLIIIAGATYAVVKGIEALGAYLTENSIQEETSARMETSARAYTQYISARAACMADCLSHGGTTSSCTSSCEALIPKPNLVVDAARKAEGLGFWGTIGLVLVAVGGGVAAVKIYQRKHHTAV